MRNEKAVDANWDKPVAVLLAMIPNIPFSRPLVEKILRERSFSKQLELLDTFGDEPTVEALLKLWRHDSSRQEFLAFYVEELKAVVAGNANCGCVHHAEDGIPCEHDMDVFNHDVDSFFEIAFSRVEAGTMSTAQLGELFPNGVKNQH